MCLKWKMDPPREVNFPKCPHYHPNGNLSHLPGDDDLLRLPIEINKRLLIDDEQPIVISIGGRRTTFRITQQKVVVKCLQ